MEKKSGDFPQAQQSNLQAIFSSSCETGICPMNKKRNMVRKTGLAAAQAGSALVCRAHLGYGDTQCTRAPTCTSPGLGLLHRAPGIGMLVLSQLPESGEWEKALLACF